MGASGIELARAPARTPLGAARRRRAARGVAVESHAIASGRRDARAHGKSARMAVARHRLVRAARPRAGPRWMGATRSPGVGGIQARENESDHLDLGPARAHRLV